MKLTKISILLLMSLLTFTCDESTKNIVLPEENIVTCDDCGVCDTDSNNTNITCTDCSGELYGDHEYDECNVCNDYTSNNGQQPQLPYGNCDCKGKTMQIDDDGNSMGHAKLDDCDECNPGTILAGPFSFIDIDCEDCNGELGGEAYLDGCRDCVGGSTGLLPCDEDCHEKLIITDVNCSDFSDDLLSCDDTPGCTYDSGSDCLPISYGYVDECGNCVTEPDENCMQICDCQWSNNENIPLEYPLCIALQNCQSECNTSGNSECILIESAYYCVEYENWNDMDCTGLCVSGTPKNNDYFMYCSTSGFTYTGLNYGLCTNPGYCSGECLTFNHEIHSDANLDECGVCSGGVTGHEENSDKDCTDTCFGEAFIDYCDTCVGGNTGLEGCIKDCAGVNGGSAEFDNCNVCDDDPNNDCEQDECGVWGGTGVIDDCVGHCIQMNATTFTCFGGGNAGGDCSQNEDADCAVGICRASASVEDGFNTTCVQDCAGIWAGESILDECGDCDSNGGTCEDGTVVSTGSCCNGFPESGTGDCVNSCDGFIIDDDCIETCLLDCAGEWGGDHEMDDCNFCDDYSDSGGIQPSYPYGDCACFVETASNFWCNSGNNTCNADGMDIQNSGAGGTYCIAECVIDNNYVNPIIENIGDIYTNIIESCEYWGCTDENANNYDESATNCTDNTNSCCIYNQVTLSLGEITDSTIEIYMQNSEAVGGFQFNLTGATINSAGGGSAEANGLIVSTSSHTVLGFTFEDDSIPSGSGLLTILSATTTSTSELICIESLIISDTSGQPLSVSDSPFCDNNPFFE